LSPKHYDFANEKQSFVCCFFPNRLASTAEVEPFVLWLLLGTKKEKVVGKPRLGSGTPGKETKVRIR
jgi:hypothetical protein